MKAGFAFLLLLLVGFAGYAIGAAQAAPVAVAGAAPVVYGMHYGFGFFGFIFPLLFIFLIFGALRSWSWGGRWYGHGYSYGPPPSFEEWHKKAHETTSTDDRPRT
ncbi:MAG: hypothetical protein HY071_04075 [Chloroflexi bacterium]|nr:hypothetical protein [Chloroflexota bacterium]